MITSMLCTAKKALIYFKVTQLDVVIGFRLVLLSFISCIQNFAKIYHDELNSLLRLPAYDSLFLGYYELHIYLWFLSTHHAGSPGI